MGRDGNFGKVGAYLIFRCDDLQARQDGSELVLYMSSGVESIIRRDSVCSESSS